MAISTVLITGATSGIGAALARKFYKEDYNLVLTGRREDRLLSLKTNIQQKGRGFVETLPLDLFLPHAPQQIFSFLREKEIPLSCLVNNAGFGGAGSFTDLPLDRQMEMIQINIKTLVQLTRLFLDSGINKGEILNVASTAGFQPGPYMAVYYASKAFVLSFTEALSHELRHTPFCVSCLCPGATDTEFQKAAGTERSLLFEKVMMSAEDVALAGYNGLKINQTIIVPGWLNKLSTFGSRLLPRKGVRIIMGKLNGNRSPAKQ